MGRWTQYDEDSYRLPEGVTRTGYNADTGRYLFNGVPGIPYARYGVLSPGQERTGFSRQRNVGQQLELRPDPLVLPIHPSKPAEASPEARNERNRESINVPNAVRALRKALLAPFAFSGNRPRKHLTKHHSRSVDPDPTAGGEKIGAEKVPASQETSNAPVLGKTPHKVEKSTQLESGFSEKATQSINHHTRPHMDKSTTNTLPHTSQSLHSRSVRRRASEPHGRSPHDPDHYAKTNQVSRGPSVDAKKRLDSPQPLIKTPLPSNIDKPSTRKPSNSQKFDKTIQTELEIPTTTSNAPPKGKKLGITDTSIRTPSRSKVSRSATLPTQKTSHQQRTFSTGHKEGSRTLDASQISRQSSPTTRNNETTTNEKSETGNPVSRTKSYPSRGQSRTAQLHTQPPSHVGSSKQDTTSKSRRHTSSQPNDTDIGPPSLGTSSHGAVNNSIVSDSGGPLPPPKENISPHAEARSQTSRKKRDSTRAPASKV